MIIWKKKQVSIHVLYIWIQTFGDTFTSYFQRQDCDDKYLDHTLHTPPSYDKLDKIQAVKEAYDLNEMSIFY